MTHFRMTTQSTSPWGADASVGHPHKHAREGRPSHHAAGSLSLGRIVLLSAAVLIVIAAALVVGLG
ncbi:hypothetical protein [Actinacidiphila paucisporea]|uniref:Uncharacterized protein n=1 Tax=Actinacidiphila paucisporea TaxID=310782 RepID=A0A1M7N019_9ACTN|nr:hypothetical protein [Actinacidiphila paucisporea]SHM96853.1 hypothetical protein SAMN05216499_11773 [Actinacidiphila paucisporea]